MIEIIMLMMLGNAGALMDVQINIDEKTELVTELEKEFEELLVKKTAQEVKLNILFNEFKQYEREEEWDNSKTRQEFVEFKAREVKSEWRVEYRILDKIIVEFNKLEHDLETAKILLERMNKDFENITKANSDVNRYNNISISLSKNCQTMIEYGLYTNCPTYRELFDTFDTTNPTASGTMTDYGYDVSRENIMKKHWKFYEYQTDFDLIMVDPDSDYQNKSVNIEIQASNFTTLSVVGSDNARGFKNGSYTTWENFKVTEDCRQIIVAPNMELITQAVEYARNNCNGEIEVLENTVIKQEPTPHNDRNWRDSPALVYQDWLRNAIENNKGLMLGG